MYFPIADLEIHPLLPPAIAFLISFFTSMGGVSGAFLLLPFQVSVLGFVSPAVSATNQLFNVVAIPGGVYRYAREGRMVWPLTAVLTLGTLPGVFLGAIIRVEYLPDPARFKLFAGLVLLFVGGRLWQTLRWQDTHRGIGEGETAVQSEPFNLRHISYHFQGERYEASGITLLLMSLVVGVVGGIYGIGGGAIIAPALVAFFRLPVHTVAGATLLTTLITSIFGVLFYQLIAPFYPHLAVAPDWGLGFLFGLGGLAGIYCGARVQKYVPARLIKLTLLACILYVALTYLTEALSSGMG